MHLPTQRQHKIFHITTSGRREIVGTLIDILIGSFLVLIFLQSDSAPAGRFILLGSYLTSLGGGWPGNTLGLYPLNSGKFLTADMKTIRLYRGRCAESYREGFKKVKGENDYQNPPLKVKIVKSLGRLLRYQKILKLNFLPKVPIILYETQMLKTISGPI